jgi:precorrin-8X/cobalt-precorrin-8 methylmutase
VFERIVVVDWSAASAPKSGRDSIWSYCTDDAEPVNHRTRASACAALLDVLGAPGATLVGFDFPFGYPAGFARRAGLGRDKPWLATWRFLADNVSDDARNHNNRWAVAADLNRRLAAPWFWGVPASHESAHLSRRKAPASDEFRLVERRLRERGLYPFAARHLLGAGSVGSQALTGIPVVHRLRHHPALESRVRIWPFETGLTTDPTGGDLNAIVIVESWPSAIDFNYIPHQTRDAQQVVALARHYAELDRCNQLAGYFRPELGAEDAQLVVDEEAWILGVQ